MIETEINIKQYIIGKTLSTPINKLLLLKVTWLKSEAFRNDHSVS